MCVYCANHSKVINIIIAHLNKFRNIITCKIKLDFHGNYKNNFWLYTIYIQFCKYYVIVIESHYHSSEFFSFFPFLVRVYIVKSIIEH